MTPSQKIDLANTILEDVEEIFTRAMAKGSFSVALRAKELLGRECGLFKQKTKNAEFSLENVSEQELSRLVKVIEKQLRLDLLEDDNVNN